MVFIVGDRSVKKKCTGRCVGQVAILVFIVSNRDLLTHDRRSGTAIVGEQQVDQVDLTPAVPEEDAHGLEVAVQPDRTAWSS